MPVGPGVNYVGGRCTEPDAGLELKRPPTDSTFRYLFLQVDVAEICRQLQVWMLAQITDSATGLDQLVCDGKTLRGSIVATDGGGGAYGLRPTASTLPR
jgi:hypothetical protein